MTKSITSSAVSWSAIEIILRQFVQFIIIVILARILSPEEFGTIALLSLFIGIATVISESGLSLALIQSQNISHNDESTVFWFNITMSAILAILLCIFAPYISNIFSKPILIPIIYILSCNIFITALGTIQRTLFVKNLNFRPLAFIGFTASLISGIFSIVLAYNNYGVWSLVFQTFIAGLVTTISLWWISPWRPQIIFKIISLKRLLSFSGYILASSIIITLYNRIYTIIIGTLYGSAELGIYNRGESTAALPSSLLNEIIGRIAFSSFSKMDKDLIKLRSGVKTSLQLFTLINTPSMLGFAVVSDPFIMLVFGEKWQAAIPILQIICFSNIFVPIHMLNLQALMAMGHSNIVFRLELLKRVFGITILIISSFFGILGLAWGVVFINVASLFFNARYAREILGYGLLSQIRDILPIIFLSISMAVFIVIISNLTIHYSLIIQLFLNISFGISFFVILIVIFKPDPFNIVKKNIFQFFHSNF